MKTDAEKLDEITDTFAKVLIANAFQDVKVYADLALRLAVIVDFEIKQNLQTDKNIDLAEFWPVGMMN